MLLKLGHFRKYPRNACQVLKLDAEYRWKDQFDQPFENEVLQES